MNILLIIISLTILCLSITVFFLPCLAVYDFYRTNASKLKVEEEEEVFCFDDVSLTKRIVLCSGIFIASVMLIKGCVNVIIGADTISDAWGEYDSGGSEESYIPNEIRVDDKILLVNHSNGTSMSSPFGKNYAQNLLKDLDDISKRFNRPTITSAEKLRHHNHNPGNCTIMKQITAINSNHDRNSSLNASPQSPKPMKLDTDVNNTKSSEQSFIISVVTPIFIVSSIFAIMLAVFTIFHLAFGMIFTQCFNFCDDLYFLNIYAQRMGFLMRYTLHGSIGLCFVFVGITISSYMVSIALVKHCAGVNESSSISGENQQLPYEALLLPKSNFSFNRSDFSEYARQFMHKPRNVSVGENIRSKRNINLFEHSLMIRICRRANQRRLDTYHKPMINWRRNSEITRKLTKLCFHFEKGPVTSEPSEHLSVETNLSSLCKIDMSSVLMCYRGSFLSVISLLMMILFIVWTIGLFIAPTEIPTENGNDVDDENSLHEVPTID